MPIGADGDRASAVPLSPGEACFLFGARCAAEGQEEHECGPAKHGAGLAVDGGDGENSPSVFLDNCVADSPLFSRKSRTLLLISDIENPSINKNNLDTSTKRSKNVDL